MSYCAAGTNGCLNLRRRESALDGRESAEWSRYPGSMARRARDGGAPFRRSSAGWMPAKIGRLSAGVGCRHPVTIRKASLMVGSMRRVWALRHQTGGQYSAVEWTRARVAICRVVAPSPQPEPASCLKSATCDVSFLRSDSRCRRYVSDLSNVTPRYLGSEQKSRVLLLNLTLISCLASMLIRWKATALSNNTLWQDKSKSHKWLRVPESVNVRWSANLLWYSWKTEISLTLFIRKKIQDSLLSCQYFCWFSFYMLVTFCNVFIASLFPSPFYLSNRSPLPPCT